MPKLFLQPDIPRDLVVLGLSRPFRGILIVRAIFHDSTSAK